MAWNDPEISSLLGQCMDTWCLHVPVLCLFLLHFGQYIHIVDTAHMPGYVMEWLPALILPRISVSVPCHQGVVLTFFTVTSMLFYCVLFEVIYVWCFTQLQHNINWQESLANAKVNARQHCVSISCLCNTLTQIEWVAVFSLGDMKIRKI